jgi:hypothetical protein
MVTVVVSELKVLGLKPGRGDVFLRAIKIRCTPSFAGEVKPKASCGKILRHVEEPQRYERDACSQNSRTFLAISQLRY